MPRNRWVLAAALGTVLALPAPASAVPAPEPNDGIQQAKGPLQHNTVYTGNIATQYEDDWFVVHDSGAGTLKIDVTNSSVNQCSDGLRMRIADADGGTLKNGAVASGNTGSLSQPLNGVGTYHVRLNGTGGTNCGGNYSFKPTGPITTGPVPGAAEGTPNTGRAPASAIGPLEGKLYGGRIDSSSEADWFFFYTNGGGSFDVVITNSAVNTPFDDGCTLEAGLFARASDDNRLVRISAYDNRHNHLRYDGPAPAHYSLRIVGDCANDDYRFRVEPASILTSTAPPPPDGDGDGFHDDVDRCATVPGTADGCPDADGDGVADSSDRCRTTAGVPPDGCPPPAQPDRDRDGFADGADRCPTVAGVAPDGCPRAAAPTPRPTVSAACTRARARRDRAKASYDRARAKVRRARTIRSLRRWSRVRAKRRTAYVAARVRARRLCA
ncbi:MAG TPA: thrombospondin type 3 repeat-containing protein [Solirubrobacteraceae bacterium]|nr:thrombospondin type 3 repeat-containing protein [Solirubrobacteraceae bacterium]